MMVATPQDIWITVNWSEPIPVIEDVLIHLGAMGVVA